MIQNTMASTVVQNEKRTLWFDNLISTLRLHEIQLDTETANPQLRKLYDVMISENFDEMFRLNKAAAQEFFVKKIIVEYLQLLGDKLPTKLAFDFNDSEVLVWAEIEDNQEILERSLTLAEAKINAKFHPYGFDMESMIVEKGDGLPVPNHYKIYK